MASSRAYSITAIIRRASWSSVRCREDLASEGATKAAIMARMARTSTSSMRVKAARRIQLFALVVARHVVISAGAPVRSHRDDVETARIHLARVDVLVRIAPRVV